MNYYFGPPAEKRRFVLKTRMANEEEVDLNPRLKERPTGLFLTSEDRRVELRRKPFGGKALQMLMVLVKGAANRRDSRRFSHAELGRIINGTVRKDPSQFTKDHIQTCRDAIGDDGSGIPSPEDGCYQFCWNVCSEPDSYKAEAGYPLEDVSPVLDAHMGEVNRKDDQDAGTLLVFEAWAEARRERWAGKSLVQTDCARQLLSFLSGEGTTPRHAVLVGSIASGKSTTTYLVLDALRAANRFQRTLILPLGIDFSGPNEIWSRAKAVQGFGSMLTGIPSVYKACTLIVCEDAHEASVLEALPWTEQGASNADFGTFNNFSVLLTCRPHALKDLVDRLKKSHDVTPRVFETDAEATAEAMVAAAVTETEQGALAKTMFHQSGFSLIALVYALLEWERQDHRPQINMTLAHQAVFSELDRIGGDLSSSDHSDLHVRCLALIWMIGGLDSPVDIDLIRKYFKIELNPHRFWRRLVRLREIAPNDSVSVPARVYANLRHPAWGQLVIHALDEEYKNDGIRSAIPAELVNRFLETPTGKLCQKALTDRDAKIPPSVCMLLALQHAKRGAPDEKALMEGLAIHCSGRFLSKEFVQASLLMIEIERHNGVDPLELCDRQFAVASNARRIAPSPWSTDQSRANLIAAHTALAAAMRTLRKTYGQDLAGYPKRGFVLYEDSYYDYRFGKFDEAEKKLKASIQVELDGGDARKPFAAMTRTRLSRVLADQGRYAESLDCAHEALVELDICERSSIGNPAMLHRFRGNTYLSIGRTFLSQRRADDAAGYIKRVAAEFEKGGVVVNLELTYARLHLAQNDAEGALRMAERFRQNSLIVNDDEMWEQYYRIVGDAHLLDGKLDEARMNYAALLPNPATDLGTEALLAQSRLQALAAGASARDIFQTSPV